MTPSAELSVGREDLTLPGITRNWGVGSFVAYSKDKSLFFAWQEKDSLDAVLIQRLWTGEQINIPLSPRPHSRPTLFASPSGLLLVAGEDLDQTHLPYVFYIHGYEWPDPGSVADPRVDGLLIQVGALSADLTATKQKIVEIETALGNISQGGLSEEQVDALAYLVAYRKLQGIP